MIIDKDFSFLRIRDSLADALDTNSGPAVELSYAGYAIQLLPGETTVQISNSPTNITLLNATVHIVDLCDNILETVTENFFITPFVDTNGITQIVFEWINTSEFQDRNVLLRFTDTASGNKYYTNSFLTTANDSDMTTRFDYRSTDEHYGTQYDRAGDSLALTGFYQSIRLKCYYNNTVNESERNAYHQISTDITISARNIRSWKDRYILDSWDDFSITRLEILATNDEVYMDTVRSFSSDPIDFDEREMDSDVSEKEALFAHDPTQTFTAGFQIFTGVIGIVFAPVGSFITGATIVEYSMTLTTTAVLTGVGQVDVFDSLDVLLVSYPASDWSVISLLKMRALSSGTPGENPADETYYVNVTAGFFTTLGVPNLAITDKTTWTFKLAALDYLAADFNAVDYLT
ncbi:MAG: hypothetical protein ACUZ8H_01385 [Candidatus Anammoxibacter sp.]